MATRRFRKPTGRSYKGMGEIYKGEQHHAKVRCDLTEYEEHLEVSEMGTRRSSQMQSGEKEVRGKITVVDGNELLISLESPLTLHFESDFSPMLISLENGKMGRNGHWAYNVIQSKGNGFDSK